MGMAFTHDLEVFVWCLTVNHFDLILTDQKIPTSSDYLPIC